MGDSKITFYGGTDIKYIEIEDQYTTLDTKLLPNYEPSMQHNTVFLIDYSKDRDGKGLVHENEGYYYSIYKIDLANANEMEFLTKITNGKMSFSDYNVVNGKQYKYIIFAETDSGVANAKETTTVQTVWDTWSLIGLKNTDNPNVFMADEENIWLLNLSLESAEQNQNMAKVEYKNLTPYPKISQGTSNYISGSITCLLGQIDNNGRYSEPAEKLDAWRNFINSSDLKLLKDIKGHSYLVQTMSSNNKLIDQSIEQINRISFSYVEVGASDNKVIYY